MGTWALRRDVELVDADLPRPVRIEDQELPLPAKEIDALVLDDYRLHPNVLIVPVGAHEDDGVPYCQLSTIHFPNSTHSSCVVLPGCEYSPIDLREPRPMCM